MTLSKLKEDKSKFFNEEHSLNMFDISVIFSVLNKLENIIVFKYKQPENISFILIISILLNDVSSNSFKEEQSLKRHSALIILEALLKKIIVFSLMLNNAQTYGKYSFHYCCWNKLFLEIYHFLLKNNHLTYYLNLFISVKEKEDKSKLVNEEHSLNIFDIF